MSLVIIVRDQTTTSNECECCGQEINAVKINAETKIEFDHTINDPKYNRTELEKLAHYLTAELQNKLDIKEIIK